MWWSWLCVIFIFLGFFLFDWTLFLCIVRFLCIVSAMWGDVAKASVCLWFTLGLNNFLQNTYFHWLWSLRLSVAQNIFLCPLAALKWVSKFTPHLVLYCLSGCGTNKHKSCICQSWPRAEQPEQGEINLPTCLQCKGLKALPCPVSCLPLSGLGPAEAAVLSTEVSLPQMDGFGEGKWLRKCWCCMG